MSYEYKDDVKRVLFEEYRVASDPTVLNTAFNMRDELDEVYAKAEAFDEIERTLNYRDTPIISKLHNIHSIVHGVDNK